MKRLAGVFLLVVSIGVLTSCGGGGGSTANPVPVSDQITAALVSKGMPEDVARFFAGATLQSSCTDTMCTNTYTYPNGATRIVTVTATANQQYTPTAAELTTAASDTNPVYNWSISAAGMSDATTTVTVGYFVPASSMTTLTSPAAKTTRPRSRKLTAAGTNTGAVVNWSEVGQKGADVAIGSLLGEGTISSAYELASLLSDGGSAGLILAQKNAWLAELDELKKCAANPSQLSQTDPNYSTNTVARLDAIRSEILMNTTMRILNQVDETSEGFMGTAGKIIGVPAKAFHAYSDETLKDLSEQLMNEARSSVASCVPTCPTNFFTTPVSETEIDLTWSGPTSTTEVVTGYNVLRGGAGLGSTPATAWSDTGLQPSRMYCYIVTATNEFGTSQNCTESCATTFGPPVVTGTTPYGGATNVPVGTTVTATFSEEIDPATINAGTFTVSGPGGPVAGTVTYSGKTATFTPSADLQNLTTYTVTITTGVKDLDGNPMKADFTMSFTTEPAAGSGNLQFSQTGVDDTGKTTVVSGYADVVWTLFDTTTPDVKGFYGSGTITADITLPDCDPVHVTRALNSDTGSGSKLNVYLSNNNLWPNKYMFTVSTTSASQTFNCGNPTKSPMTIPLAISVTVGSCNFSQTPVPFSDQTRLTETNWTCGEIHPGVSVINNTFDASWDFIM